MIKRYSKYILILVALFSIIMCSSTSETLKFNQDQQLFISEFNGGSREKGFKILETEAEFHQEYSRNKFSDVISEDVVYPQYPEGQKVVLYNLGEYRAGDHRVLGIDSFEVKNDVLTVYMKNKIVNPSQDLMQIQVVTTPWMMFSVTKTYQFSQVELR